jgi:hypothetical protein
MIGALLSAKERASRVEPSHLDVLGEPLAKDSSSLQNQDYFSAEGIFYERQAITGGYFGKTARATRVEMMTMAIKFVLVNHRTPRKSFSCSACFRSLERTYVHDLSTHNCYCGTQCYYGIVGGLIRSFATQNPFEQILFWQTTTINVALALADTSRPDQ